MKDNTFIIVGKTRDDEKFRPSDWTKRLICTASVFNNSKRIRYHHHYLTQCTVEGVPALCINLKLKTEERTLYKYLKDFARDNDLVIIKGRRAATRPDNLSYKNSLLDLLNTQIDSAECVTTSAKMTKTTHAFGLTSYKNNEVVLAGGMNSGNSDTDHTRLKYMIYDIRDLDPKVFKANQEKYKMGFVELFISKKGIGIDGLINIQLRPKSRGNGIGRIVIQSILATTETLKVYDIKQKAVPFWRKMGAKFYKDPLFLARTKTTSDKRSKKEGLYAILSKVHS